MRLRNPIPCSTVSVLIVTVLAGCHGFSLGRPVTVLVRDAETKAPIKAAEVQIASASGHLPTITAATTGDNGIARVKVNPSADIAYMVEASANGYFSEEEDISVETLREISPAKSIHSGANEPPTLILEMFAGPRPTVDLIVPMGFRGVLRAQVRGRDDAPYPPGQRPSVIPCRLAAWWRSLDRPFSGMASLPTFALASPMGLRCPATRRTTTSVCAGCGEGDDQVFFVGTRVDWADYCHSLEPYEPRGSSGGKKGGAAGAGVGRGGRRGGGMGHGGMGGMSGN